MPWLPQNRNSRPVYELRALMDGIRSQASEAASIDDLKGRLEPILDKWWLASPAIAPGLKLFRAQIVNERPSNLSRMSYPPPSIVKEDGRCNRAGDSVFYASLARASAAFESRPQPGDHLCLVHYETTNKLHLMRVGYTRPVMDALGSERQIPGHATIGYEQYSEQETLVNEFLSELFTASAPGQEHWRYRISIAVAEKLLLADVGGLMYPSIAMSANADNVALKPDFVDRYLRPIHAEMVEITGVEKSSVSFDGIDEARAFDAHGRIKWLGHLGQWTLTKEGEEFLFERVDGHWVGRDQSGVDPH